MKNLILGQCLNETFTFSNFQCKASLNFYLFIQYTEVSDVASRVDVMTNCIFGMIRNGIGSD